MTKPRSDPESGPIRTIHHVMVAIPSGMEVSARDFYNGVIGLAEIPKPDVLQGRGGLWFRVGDLELHLGVDADFHAARKAHIAFLVDDLAALRQQVLEHDLVLVSDDLLPGFDRFYLDDPFGNRLEFLEPLPQ